jgi:hypothetical protein
LGRLLGFATTLAVAASVPGDWIRLQPPGENFHIFMPPDWQQSPPIAQNATKLSIVAPSSRGPGYFAKCAVIVMATPNTANYTQAQLDAYIAKGVPDGMVNMIASEIQGFSLRARTVTNVADRPAFFLSFAGRFVTAGAGVYTVAAQIAELRPGKTYDVTCTASDATESSTPQQAEIAWRAWQPDIMTILSTFVIDD